MTRRLLVNADDFGLTPGVNRAIIELHRAGALHSATLMATGPAFADAVDLALQHPQLGVGCHVVLTDGAPVLEPRAIRTLLGPDRLRFRPSLLGFAGAALAGRVRPDEVTREAEAQIRRLQHAGLRVTHIDTHKHTHALPSIAGALLRAAESTGVPAIRNPFEPAWSLRIGRASLLRRLQVLLAGRLRRRFERLIASHAGRIVTTGGTIGVSATGHLDQPTLRHLLEALPEGTWELVCHPGYNDSHLAAITTRLRASREVERDALLRELGRDAASGSSDRPSPQVIHFGDLAQNSL